MNRERRQIAYQSGRRLVLEEEAGSPQRVSPERECHGSVPLYAVACKASALPGLTILSAVKCMMNA